MINIKKLLLFICLFFLFNTLEIDSHSDKHLIYNKDELYEEYDYYVFFNNTNTKELSDVLNILNIEVLSYIIDGEKYYVNNIDELMKDYLNDKNDIDRLYYNKYGIPVDGIHVKCINNELIKLENLINVI